MYFSFLIYLCTSNRSFDSSIVNYGIREFYIFLRKNQKQKRAQKAQKAQKVQNVQKAQKSARHQTSGFFLLDVFIRI